MRQSQSLGTLSEYTIASSPVKDRGRSRRRRSKQKINSAFQWWGMRSGIIPMQTPFTSEWDVRGHQMFPVDGMQQIQAVCFWESQGWLGTEVRGRGLPVACGRGRTRELSETRRGRHFGTQWPDNVVGTLPSNNILERLTTSGEAPPQSPPPPPRPSDHSGIQQEMSLGRSCRAIFGTQTFESQTPPPLFKYILAHPTPSSGPCPACPY